MAVKAILFDLAPTLVDPVTLKKPDGVEDALAKLDALEVAVYAATSRPQQNMVHAGKAVTGLDPANVIYAAAKGSRRAVRAIQIALGIEAQQILVVGKGDSDMHEAVNSGCLYIHAKWSEEPDYEYGIQIANPSGVPKLVEDFFLTDDHWYLKVDDTDNQLREICVRARMDIRTAGDPKGVKGHVKGWTPIKAINGYNANFFLWLQVLASIYMEGLMDKRTKGHNPIWCMWPGSQGEANELMSDFESIAAPMLKCVYAPDVLIRWKKVESQHSRRANRKPAKLSTQLSSVRLNEDWADRIRGNTIFVMDDFTTDGNSFETARNLLYAAGANSVVCVAIGSFGNYYYVAEPLVELHPFDEWDYVDDDFNRRNAPVVINQGAQGPFIT